MLENFNNENKLLKLFYRKINSTKDEHLYLIKLLTGRKHQIRLQFFLNDNPIIGDKKFSKKLNFLLNTAEKKTINKNMISKNTLLDIEETERPNDIFGRFLLKIVTYLAICGGIVLVVIVLINFISIAGRTMFGKPLTGDFELVEMGCAIAMFSFLPLCQFKNGNVIVDFFTINII